MGSTLPKFRVLALYRVEAGSRCVVKGVAWELRRVTDPYDLGLAGLDYTEIRALVYWRLVFELRSVWTPIQGELGYSV